MKLGNHDTIKLEGGVKMSKETKNLSRTSKTGAREGLYFLIFVAAVCCLAVWLISLVILWIAGFPSGAIGASVIMIGGIFVSWIFAGIAIYWKYPEKLIQQESLKRDQR